MIHWLSIVTLCILACVFYGVIHDQVTVRICLEYFTIGHPKVIPSKDPTVLALTWGVIATWWVGLILGIPLASVARVGRRPKRSIRSLYRPIAILVLSTGSLAAITGVIGYSLASAGVIHLVGGIAELVPPEKHVPFLTDLWIHNASYLGGFVGGTIVIVSVWRSRRVVQALPVGNCATPS